MGKLRAWLGKPFLSRGGALAFFLLVGSAQYLAVLSVRHPAVGTVMTVAARVLLAVMLARFGWLAVRHSRRRH